MVKKLRPSHKYTYLTFLILFVALTFLLWTICGTKSWLFEGNYLKERLWVELTYIFSSFLFCFLGALIYYLKVYYIIDNTKITRKGNKEREYFFKDIIYLDDEYTSKHNDLLIYVNSGKWTNLTMDPKKELLRIIKSKCQLLSKDDFMLKYPEAYAQIRRNK